MKISFNWLKEYLKFDLTAEETGKYLTDCGLEVEGLEEFEIIKGGLRGLVVGKVLTCEAHPDSDHLHVTTVDTACDQPLNIVCGAANVAEGQKVIVATIGTTLYKGEESFVIKKSKIRGVVSEGMICAEDEIGVGTSHDGIMVLPEEAVIGMPAADYFKMPVDSVFEIGLTPNRSDAISHFGVARDLYAMLQINKIKCSPLLLPNVHNVYPNSINNTIDITVKDTRACPRYSGITLDNIVVKSSPEWLQNHLKSIGVRPVNNIVDVTQFVMFEIGQPLHAFDADKIKGKQVIIQTLPEGTPFTTLDGSEIKLSQDDLMVCNAEEGMCIAGVYGGKDSGVSEHTTKIFLESAYFNAVSIRKTSKRHGLKTDASFRFERGCDPDITVYALKRAANLIQEITEAHISSEIIDVYPSIIERNKISLHYDDINKVAGKKIDKQIVSSILLCLGMEVQAIDTEKLMVTIPLNKVDVTRPIDLIEEILRIYGYNNIDIPTLLSYNIHSHITDSQRKKQLAISCFLADNGFYEVMNNSLTRGEYAQKFDFIDSNETVILLNPLSSELNAMRQTLLPGGLENIVKNSNNKNSNLRLFEFGKTYHHVSSGKEEDVTEKYTEKNRLSLFVTGKDHDDLWNAASKEMDFFYLKNIVHNILCKINFPFDELDITENDNSIFINNITYKMNGETLVSLGELHPQTTKYFDIKKRVYYAEFDASILYQYNYRTPVSFTALPQYPAVKRDLSLVIDNNISYQTLEAIGYKYGGKLLKSVNLFDIYKGDKIEAGKKSYALNFVLQHSDKTLTDEEINKVMNKLIAAYQREVEAQLR